MHRFNPDRGLPNKCYPRSGCIHLPSGSFHGRDATSIRFSANSKYESRWRAEDLNGPPCEGFAYAIIQEKRISAQRKSSSEMVANSYPQELSKNIGGIPGCRLILRVASSLLAKRTGTELIATALEYS